MIHEIDGCFHGLGDSDGAGGTVYDGWVVVFLAYLDDARHLYEEVDWYACVIYCLPRKTSEVIIKNAIVFV